MKRLFYNIKNKELLTENIDIEEILTGNVIATVGENEANEIIEAVLSDLICKYGENIKRINKKDIQALQVVREYRGGENIWR